MATKKEKEPPKKRFKYDQNDGFAKVIEKITSSPPPDHGPVVASRTLVRLESPPPLVEPDAWKTPHSKLCSYCYRGGEILCCDICPASFHLPCHHPPIVNGEIPEGKWICNRCKNTPSDQRIQMPSLSTHSTVPGNIEARIKMEHEWNDAYVKAQVAKRNIAFPNIELANIMAKANAVSFVLPSYLRKYEMMVPNMDRKTTRLNILGERCSICLTKNEQSEMILCDFCPRYFHIDCIRPPMASVPRILTWMCPIHVEPIIDQKLLNGSLSISKRRALWEQWGKYAVNDRSAIHIWNKTMLRASQEIRKKYEREAEEKDVEEVSSLQIDDCQPSTSTAMSEEEKEKNINTGDLYAMASLLHLSSIPHKTIVTRQTHQEIRRSSRNCPQQHNEFRWFDQVYELLPDLMNGQASPKQSKEVKSDVDDEMKEEGEYDSDVEREVPFPEEELLSCIRKPPTDDVSHNIHSLPANYDLLTAQIRQLATMAPVDSEQPSRWVLDVRSRIRAGAVSTDEKPVIKDSRTKRIRELDQTLVMIGFGRDIVHMVASSLASAAVVARSPPMPPAHLTDSPSFLRSIAVSSSMSHISDGAIFCHTLPSNMKYHVSFAYDYSFESGHERDDFYVSSMAIWSRACFNDLMKIEQEKDPMERPVKEEVDNVDDDKDAKIDDAQMSVEIEKGDSNSIETDIEERATSETTTTDKRVRMSIDSIESIESVTLSMDSSRNDEARTSQEASRSGSPMQQMDIDDEKKEEDEPEDVEKVEEVRGGDEDMEIDDVTEKKDDVILKNDVDEVVEEVEKPAKLVNGHKLNGELDSHSADPHSEHSNCINGVVNHQNEVTSAVEAVIGDQESWESPDVFVTKPEHVFCEPSTSFSAPSSSLANEFLTNWSLQSAPATPETMNGICDDINEEENEQNISGQSQFDASPNHSDETNEQVKDTEDSFDQMLNDSDVAESKSPVSTDKNDGENGIEPAIQENVDDQHANGIEPNSLVSLTSFDSDATIPATTSTLNEELDVDSDVIVVEHNTPPRSISDTDEMPSPFVSPSPDTPPSHSDASPSSQQKELNGIHVSTEDTVDEEKKPEAEEVPVQQTSESTVDKPLMRLMSSSSVDETMMRIASGPLIMDPTSFSPRNHIECSGPLILSDAVLSTPRGTSNGRRRGRPPGSGRGRGRGKVTVSNGRENPTPRGRGRARGKRGSMLGRASVDGEISEKQKAEWQRLQNENALEDAKEARQEMTSRILKNWADEWKNDYINARDTALQKWEKSDWDTFLKETFEQRRKTDFFDSSFFLPGVSVHAYLKVVGNDLLAPIGIQRALTKIGFARDCHIRVDKLSRKFCVAVDEYHCDVVFDEASRTLHISTIGTSRIVVDGEIVGRRRADLRNALPVVPIPRVNCDLPITHKVSHSRNRRLKCECEVDIRRPLDITNGIVRVFNGSRVRVGCVEFEVVFPRLRC